MSGIRLVLALVTVFLSSFSMIAQDRHLNGYFPVNNYTNDDFNSPVQIWTGTQVENGVFLFGNDRKIIRFDGTDWSFVLKNPEDTLYSKKQIDDKKVYSIFLSEDSTCYVARDHSLGIVHYNNRGEHVYTPFYYSENLKDVWSIYESGEEEIFFIASDQIIKYNKKTKTVQKVDLGNNISSGRIESSVKVNDGVLLFVYFSDKKEGSDNNGKEVIYKYDFKTKEYNVVGFDSNRQSFIFRSSYKVNSTYYLCDYFGEVFKYDSSTNKLSFSFSLEKMDEEKLKVNDIIYHKGLLWAGTENNVLGIYNIDGSLIRVFGETEGVQDLNVFSLFFDQDDNLWLNLDNGISSIEFSSPTTRWNRMHNLEGSIEAIIKHNNEIVTASRSGIFKSISKLNRLVFTNTNVISESTFDLKAFDTDYGEKLLFVGYNGVYEIHDFSSPAIPLKKELYGWELFQSPFNKNQIYIGGEQFLGRFTIDKNGWHYESLSNFTGDIISFAYKDEYLYFSVYGEGIYTIDETDSIIKLPKQDQINVDNSHFYLSNFENNIYAGFSKGFVKINNDSVTMVYAKNLQLEELELNIHRLFAHPTKNELWAVIFDETTDDTKKIIGYFKHNKQKLEWVDLNSKSLERGVIFDIQCYDDLIYFRTTKGLVVFDRHKLENVRKKWRVYINEITVSGEKVMNIPDFSKKIAPIEYGNPIRFSMSSASYFMGGEVEYRSRLIGLTDAWSEYEKTNFKVFDQLPHGEYIFEVQGKNYYNTESEIYRFKFSILPPWYLTWWAYTIYVIAFIVIIIITTRISIYRVRQQNKLLEETVNERTKEIAEKNNALEKQKNEIIEINEDLLSSIKYAKRIQDTILPSQEILSTYFNDSFVYFLPKDIVSGDFYWARKFDNKVIWTAVDCTGHGVPGAFVSIVGNNALIRSTNEFGLTKPANILNKLRDLVIQAFKAQGTNDVKDGMDLALVSLDLDTLELNYAGANNPLIIIRNKEIIEIKADKQPIGDFEIIKPFTNHVVKLQKGDCIYLYSDGYIDQFGGPNEASRNEGGKKFKSKPFKDLLIEIADLPMKEQKEILVTTFNEWKGDLDQIDDVCVFGVRI
ncbi:MAG: SpoIIE family protein phosphatase [Brumimicrobium sp.]